MFGIGWSELLVVLAVAILVIGPKDLPRVLYWAGKMARKIKLITHDLQRLFEEVTKEEELNDIIHEANKPGGDNLQFEIDRQASLEEEHKKNGPNS